MTSSSVYAGLEKLERSNRRLKTSLAAFACCAVAVLLTGASTASTSSKVIDAEKISLHDSAGNERGQLFATEKAWGLVLFNKDGSKAASFVASPAMNGVLVLESKWQYTSKLHNKPR